MGAHAGSEGPTRGRAGRHRRNGQALIERRDHIEEKRARRVALPSPSPSALVGIAVLVLIGVGVIHLSSTGTAVPLEEDPAAIVATGRAPDLAAADDASPPEPESAPAPPPAGTSPPGGRSAELVVHVSGAVGAPGVVRLPSGSRVDDALQAAGGPTPEADLTAVNLARPLSDGEQIHVPVPGEEPPAAAGVVDGSPPPPSDDGATAGGGGGGPINLNTASATELEELPGVGPAIAQRILEHREKNGPFTSVDGLLEVSGIGPATLEKIRDRATV